MQTEIVVYDANILIDIYDMGILEQCAALGLRVHTASLVCSEIVSEQQWAAMDKYLRIEVLPYDTLQQFIDLQRFMSGFLHKSNLSMPDFSVLKLAKELSVPLYTSDRRLRNIAVQTGVETYGSLHIVVLLNAAGLLPRENAVAALELLRRKNPRISNMLIDTVIDQLL